MLEWQRVCVVRWEEPSCRDYQAEQNGGLNSFFFSGCAAHTAAPKAPAWFLFYTSDSRCVCFELVLICSLKAAMCCTELHHIVRWSESKYYTFPLWIQTFQQSSCCIKIFFNRSVGNENIELVAGSHIRALFVLCIIWPWCRRSVLSCHRAHFSVRFIDERTSPDPLTSLFPT